MEPIHPDAAVINHIGAAAICERFGITRQAVHYWRKKGVPKEYRMAMIELAEARNLEAAEEQRIATEMRKMRDRLVL